MAPINSLKLVHELQVHQIELEMQNDELRSTKTSIEESRARFSDLYDYSPVGYVTLDEKGIILETNVTMVRMTGFEKESMLQRPLHSFVFPEDKDFFLEFFHRLIPLNAKTTVEIRISRKDGTAFTAQVETIGYKNSDKSAQQFLLAVFDITKRVEMEELLRIKSDDLAYANRELEAFSYSVSHDLRNPLNSINACLAVINNDLETMGQDSRDAIGHIVKTTQRMAQVITDLLTLSSIATQDLHCETADLSEMVGAFVSELKSANANRTIEVVIAPGCVVNADPGLVRLMVENLVRNAWKYTSKTEHASIEFGSRKDDSRTTYFMKDNGVGFDMNDSDKLFKPFVRLHSDKDFKGTGIGLAIVKRIVDKHHGEIWAQAEKGKGATFYFRFE